jgi:prephenate dehydratase
MTRVAIQGIAGSYSDEAANRIFGSGARLVECGDFCAAFDAVGSGDAQFAVVPVRNRIVGEIVAVTELIASTGVRVMDSLELEVQHVLAGTPDAELSDVRSVRSHVEALRQCSNYLTANPHLTQVIGADTASSIRRIVLNGAREHAAIGSRRAAELYGARILAENIANSRKNWTTFCLIGNK